MIGLYFQFIVKRYFSGILFYIFCAKVFTVERSYEYCNIWIDKIDKRIVSSSICFSFPVFHAKQLCHFFRKV